MNAAARRVKAPTFDVESVRADFPILSRLVHGKPLVYLDSAASAQKPRAVIEAVTRAYTEDYANVHRGAYYLSETSTVAYEAAREKVSRNTKKDSRKISPLLPNRTANACWCRPVRCECQLLSTPNAPQHA